MKKLILFSVLFLITLYFATAKEPPKKMVQPAKKEVEKPKIDSQAIADLFNKLPDSTVFEFDGQRNVIYFKDAEDLAFQMNSIIKAAKEQNPKTAIEWAMFFISLLAAGRLLPVFIQARKVGKKVVDFFGKEHNPLNILILAASAVAVGGTFLWNRGGFDVAFFFSILGWVFSISVIVYQKIIKPKEKQKEAV